jgi:hypothetical protein
MAVDLYQMLSDPADGGDAAEPPLSPVVGAVSHRAYVGTTITATIETTDESRAALMLGIAAP